MLSSGPLGKGLPVLDRGYTDFRDDTPSRHSCITASPTTPLSVLCSPFCFLCSLFGCRCPFLSLIHAFPGSLHAFSSSLYAFLCPSSSAPRWPARSTGRTRRPTGRSFWPPSSTGRFFFIRRLCRFLVSSRLLVLMLLRTALRTEVDSFIGKLRAAVRAR